jgi:hypothetical protein
MVIESPGPERADRLTFISGVDVFRHVPFIPTVAFSILCRHTMWALLRRNPVIEAQVGGEIRRLHVCIIGIGEEALLKEKKEKPNCGFVCSLQRESTR